MKKLNDFGEKIGGAKKDIWAMFHTLSDDEQTKMAVKSKVWVHPNYEKLKKDVPMEVLFWRDEMRNAVKSKPESNPEEYVTFCKEFQRAVEECSSLDDIKAFYKNNNFFKEISDKKWKYTNSLYKKFVDGNAVLRYVYHMDKLTSDSAGFLKDKVEYEYIEATSNNLTSEKDGEKYRNTIVQPNSVSVFFDAQNWTELLSKAENDTLQVVMYKKRKIGIALSKTAADSIIENHKNKSKKDSFLPPHLSVIKRTGSNYNFFRMTDGNVILARYGLRGGEFGNYTTSKDRLGSINMAYDAFEDLYKAIGISPKDISLGGNLAIAFGARGRGPAMAHFEPAKNVINITKFRGAGSLAHEWGHALDWYIGKHFNLHGFASANLDGVPESMKVLVNSFMMQNGQTTDFYKASKSFDKKYKKSGNGYWSSALEMFARAFACYVKDKLGTNVSDYLIGHAEYAVDRGVYAYPRGDERKKINENFDCLFQELVSKKLFSKEETKTVETKDDVQEIVFFESSDGQMLFC